MKSFSIEVMILIVIPCDPQLQLIHFKTGPNAADDVTSEDEITITFTMSCRQGWYVHISKG